MRQDTVMRAVQDVVERLEHGARLPAERQLARQIGCSRETLRAALAGLERSGRIWRHVGQGTFCGPGPRDLPIRDTLLIDGATPADLIRARLALEPQVAAEAARKSTRADVAVLERLLAVGRAATRASDCEQADNRLHRAIAQITGNPVFVGLMTYLSNARRHATWQRGWETSYRMLPTKAFQTAHSDQHQQIVAAIAAARPDDAAAAMTRHLQTIEAAFSRPSRDG